MVSHRGRASCGRVRAGEWPLPRFFNDDPDCFHHLDGCDRLGRPAAATHRGGASRRLGLDRLHRSPVDSDLLCRRLAAYRPAEAVGPVLADHLAAHRPGSDFPYVLRTSLSKSMAKPMCSNPLGTTIECSYRMRCARPAESGSDTVGVPRGPGKSCGRTGSGDI